MTSTTKSYIQVFELVLGSRHLNSKKGGSLSSILINNFPKRLSFLNSWDKEHEKWNREVKSFAGFHASPHEVESGYDSALRKFFLSLLLHEVVYLRHQDYLDCLNLIGFENMMELMKDDAVRVVYDVHDFTYSYRDARWQLSSMMRLAPLRDIVDGYSSIECESKGTQDELRRLTEKHRVFFDVNPVDGATDEYANLIINEASRDVEEESLALQFGFSPNGTLTAEKALYALRICDVLTGYSMQRQLGVETILQDAFALDYVNHKILLAGQKDRSVQCFETILEHKGVPDIYELYKNGLIDFQDVLAIRNSSQAGLFRRWIREKQYDEREVMIELLKPCKSSIQSRFVSFIVPTSLGLINPALGIFAAAGESFFLKMLADRWNPKLFLDESLSAFLDQKIKSQSERPT